MSNTVPAGEGTMAAVVGLAPDIIESVISKFDGVTMANFNCPGQIVITGKTESVVAAIPELQAAGAKRALQLNVSGPFHSPMLKPAGDALRTELDKAEIGELTIPYIANATAEFVNNKDQVKDLLQVQVSSPVKWEQSLLAMKDAGVDVFVEIGPGKTIAGFVKKTCPEIPVINVSTVDDVEACVAALNEMANK